MTTMTHAPRTTEPICPPWCAGHNDTGYQSWETLTADGSKIRDHDAPVQVVGGLGIAVQQYEREGGKMNDPSVWVYPDDLGDDHHLRPSQARELARLLIAAADRIDAEIGR